MSAPEDKEKSSSTDPPVENNKVKDTKMLPMQLDKESLEAIMKGVLQAEKCKKSVPGGSGTQPRSTLNNDQGARCGLLPHSKSVIEWVGSFL